VSKAHFSGDLFRFLKDLAKNNDRDWFQENKRRYETVLKEPALAFISDFESHLLKVSPHFRADAGSLFRIHRDTRFSKDKSPYKTHCGIQFRHRGGKDVHAPGFYLHIEPKESFFGVGLWRPEPPLAAKVREAIATETKAWKAAAHDKKFTKFFELGGESLKRPPRGYDDDHPAIEDLKRKDFIAACNFTDKEVLAPGFLSTVAERCKAGAPFMKFLCRAAGVGF
jgi:uncharacterized protein (TIGR02453 family)